MQRNGENYLNVNNVKIHQMDLSHFSLASKYKSIPQFITQQINNVLNASWRLLKADIDPTLKKFFGNVIQSIITPMFDAITIQNFFQHA